MGASSWGGPGTGPLSRAVDGTGAERGWWKEMLILTEEMRKAWLV